MSALAVLSLFFLVSSGLSSPENDRPSVTPEYLDHLLKTEQYERFAEVMNIPDVSLVRPQEGARNENPMFNKDLEMGDIVPAFRPLKEESRQGLRFDKYGGSKWQNNVIPYYIARDHYTPEQEKVIKDSIDVWNNQVRCLKIRPWRHGDKDFVFILNSNGCWSHLGRIGGQQSLSLQANGCVSKGTVLHEFQHAAGFAHEQNRSDRDDWIEILWENIPDEWKSQYEKTNPNDFGLQGSYDYYSIMHYTVKAPGTNKDAYRVKANGINELRIGNGGDFTTKDINKINEVYCQKCQCEL